MESLEEALAEGRRKYRNWGRWGTDDIRGTLNFIDNSKRAEAASLVRRGHTISLAMEFNRDGPQNGSLGRSNPVHTMLKSGLDAAAGVQGFTHGFGMADDVVYMPLQSGTQWDGLGHIYDNKLAWNGRPCDRVVTGAGDVVTGIERQAAEFVSRGVLLDVGRALAGADAGGNASGELPDGFAITEEHLLATIAAQGATSSVGRGDIAVVRTGQLARCRKRGSWGDYADGPAPGISFGALGWLHRTEVAAVATDTWGFEVRPYEFNELCTAPLHQIAVPNMGLFIGEMFDLEALGQDCAADGVYEFLLIAAPLPITGGVGAPVNPIAVK
jgi:kynurenine formamidase